MLSERCVRQGPFCSLEKPPKSSQQTKPRKTKTWMLLVGAWPFCAEGRADLSCGHMRTFGKHFSCVSFSAMFFMVFPQPHFGSFGRPGWLPSVVPHAHRRRKRAWLWTSYSNWPLGSTWQWPARWVFLWVFWCWEFESVWIDGQLVSCHIYILCNYIYIIICIRILYKTIFCNI